MTIDCSTPITDSFIYLPYLYYITVLLISGLIFGLTLSLDLIVIYTMLLVSIILITLLEYIPLNIRFKMS